MIIDTDRQPASIHFIHCNVMQGKEPTLHWVDFQERLSEPFVCEAKFQTNQQIKKNLTSIIGSLVTIAIAVDEYQQQHRYINGYVTNICSDNSTSQNLPTYRIRLESSLWILKHRVRSRIFFKKTINTIVKDIFFEHGLLVEFFLRDKNRVDDIKEYYVQYRESDANFLRRLLEQSGIYFYFKHEKKQHTLVLTDTCEMPSTIPGYETILLNPQASHVKGFKNELSFTQHQQALTTSNYKVHEYDYLKANHHIPMRQTRFAPMHKGEAILPQSLTIDDYGSFRSGYEITWAC